MKICWLFPQESQCYFKLTHLNGKWFSKVAYDSPNNLRFVVEDILKFISRPLKAMQCIFWEHLKCAVGNFISLLWVSLTAITLR